MAIKKPLVITAGDIEQLQSGDMLDTNTVVVTVTNNTVSTIVAGSPVYVSAAGEISLASATADASSKVLGVVLADISASSTGQVVVAGIVTLTTGQWDAVAGTSGGLTFNTQYYLSATAGAITSTAPSTVGQYVAKLLVALSTTAALLRPHQRVKL